MKKHKFDKYTLYKDIFIYIFAIIDVNLQDIIDCKSIKLLNVIKQTNYGEVWRAQWKDIEVGVHKIREEDIYFYKIFDDLHKICKINHFNIVKLYGLCVASVTELWFVMELCDLTSIFSILSDPSQKVAFSTRWQWGQQAALAQKTLFENGVFSTVLISNFLLVNGKLKHLSLNIFCNINLIKDSNSFGNIGNKHCSWGPPPGVIHSLGMVLWKIIAREINVADLNDEQLFQVMRDEKTPDVKEVPELMGNIIVRCWDEDRAKCPSSQEVYNYFVEHSKRLGLQQ